MREESEFGSGLDGKEIFSSTLLDFAHSLEQTGGDAELLKELCNVLLADIPRYMELAAAALQAEDLVRLQQHIRSLRAACAAIGAAQVTAVAVLLEAHCNVDDIYGARLKFSQLTELTSALSSELRKWAGSDSGKQDFEVETIDSYQAGVGSCHTNILNTQQ